MNIANSVISEENASASKMNTKELLNLFLPENSQRKGDPGSSGGNASKDKKESSGDTLSDEKIQGVPKSAVESLQELWDDSQYKEEYDLNSFIASMKSG